MITLNELKYVNAWTSKCPYPGVEYATLAAKKLVESYEDYKKHYLDKRYSVILSSGDQFDFEIYTKNICHMLGIDYKNLTGEYFEKFRSEVLGVSSSIKSYDLLKAIIDNIDEVLKYDEKTNGKVLNYYKLMIKSFMYFTISNEVIKSGIKNLELYSVDIKKGLRNLSCFATNNQADNMDKFIECYTIFLKM